MKFFGVHIQDLESEKFLASSNDHIATWVFLHAICSKQCNSGLISDAENLTERFWSRHGVEIEILLQPSRLWSWTPAGLIVEPYDIDGQTVFERKRAGGIKGASNRWNRTPIDSPNAPDPTRPNITRPDLSTFAESGADAYEAIPTGNKPHLLDLERKVQSLRAEWRLPLSYAEQQALLGNARCLDSLSAEDWQTIRDYLQARIPQGVPAWQPRQRHKFLETCADVASHAFSWKQKQEDRRPAPQRPTQIQPRKLISREELAEAFSPIRNHEEKV